MDFLLRVVTPRNLLLAAALLASILFSRPYRGYPAAWYRRWRYPALGAAGPMGAPISAELQEKEKRRVEEEGRRVAALLDLSDVEGFDVSPLRERLRQAMLLNDGSRRFEASALLARLEMDIPRKKVQYIPMEEAVAK